MEILRLSRPTQQLLKRGVEALELVGRELKRYNDQHEDDRGDSTTNEVADNE
jgi:hypothetical protein